MSVLGSLSNALGMGLGLGRDRVSGGLYDEVSLNMADTQAYHNMLSNAGLGSNNSVHQQWVQAAAQAVSTRPQPLSITSVRHAKIHTQTCRLVDQLPMSIAGRIESCAYYERDDQEDRRFVITFIDKRTLTFYDVDAFPSGEHVGRIALACPE